MTIAFLHLTAHDPLVARDGRPFGVNQGQRMRGLPWLLPSVVAGSFRTALVKANPTLNFSGEMPKRLLEEIAVAGVFPAHKGELYLPAPNDVLAEPKKDSKEIKTIHRVIPREVLNSCDFPDQLPLWPVMLPDHVDDFKPADLPAWWPLSKMVEWLTLRSLEQNPEWLKHGFLNAPAQAVRDHVALEAERGAAEEGKIFASSNLHVTHLPRFEAKNHDDRKVPFDQRYAEIALSARVKIAEADLQNVDLKCWHPLGGERRLIHWSKQGDAELWKCPAAIRSALKDATRIRMVLASPAIFSGGWKPGWLTNGLEGELFGVKLKLVGVSIERWRAVSGWSLAKTNEKGKFDPNGKPGPKAIRRMVPAGSVYFFEVEKPGDAAPLADQWLESVSDGDQEQRDGFGLALWGTW